MSGTLEDCIKPENQWETDAQSFLTYSATLVRILRLLIIVRFCAYICLGANQITFMGDLAIKIEESAKKENTFFGAKCKRYFLYSTQVFLSLMAICDMIKDLIWNN